MMGGGGGKGFHVCEDSYFWFIFFFSFWFPVMAFQKCSSGGGGIIRSSASQVPLRCTADRIKTIVSVYDVVLVGVICDFLLQRRGPSWSISPGVTRSRDLRCG